jgi:hypothetical protein
MRNAYGVLVRKHERRDHCEDFGLDRRIILKWILKKQTEGMWTGFIWLKIGTNGRLLCRQ